MFKYLATLEKFCGECAFRFLNEENTFEVSYEQYLKDIRTCATRLEKVIGDLKGKHVALIGLNNYEYIVTMAALLFSRAVFIPINYRESAQNIEFAVKNSKTEIIITDNLDENNFGDEFKYFGFDIALAGDAEEKDLKDFTDEEENDLLMIVYTSGTTGLSKGVALSVGNIFKDVKETFPINHPKGYKAVPGIKAYVNFPFYHIAGLLAWLTCTEHGVTFVQSVNPHNVLTDLENEQIDYAGVHPATIKLWLKTIKRGHIERLGGVKLIITGCAPMSISDIQDLQNNGISFGQFYGMTETGGNITVNYDMENHIGSVGRTYEDAEISIIDGEICISYWGNMLGYFENEEETKKAVKDGIIYTGDLGYIDEDGYLYITGRKKSLIILSSGENVSPEELENLLYKCADVKECKAFEKKDRIAVAIYAEEESQDNIREYISELNKTLPIYKRIYGIEFQTEELEKTANGKIKRRETVA
ncbi:MULTISPECIES: class I adenylate-forming enzyme family protein [Pseudobutyrivibrio]|uniref:Long-chain acyl-CoA synthetase n=1 Tax=Pseudobutyrivibrio xylanivorans TaxID=185007 RepID=A0A1G5S1E5_PSEXY|nr:MULTISPECIES: class I adenylate-forming enzyme family protein [Pseudobutyrivibrio]MDC7280469.1 acyl--CoA ligase [Butyrivibrio fibrisolvens]SCZ80133.1 long-chain acyl-CoA synthetase [Pseudobutyrivibrio xylanivorans]